ncbi:MAG: hypoxanthine phosphoribosyltransferase [Deltaproteobacteria bacterium]|nr:hypoxanthine phosphoribosyltransferase [Deltaproteobacteria bacterium]
MPTAENERPMRIGEDFKVLLAADDIATRVRELGQAITRDYEGKELTLVAVLKGSFLFMADLARAIDLPLTCEFLGLSSYGSRRESSGIVKITQDLTQPVKGRHVLVVEDIIDTGLTISYLISNLRTRLPESVRIAALLYKPDNNKIPCKIDYLGFTIPNKFVVGYGLDLDGCYRNLPFIGVKSPDDAA